MLHINSDPIGKGRERSCFVHPDDPGKAIKISAGTNREQSDREIRFYQKLQKRNNACYSYIPQFYGLSDTNYGRGIIVELIRDYDNEISKPLDWYLKQGYPIEEFEPYLEKLKQAFLEYLIIFNHDMHIGNLLFQKLSESEARLVTIDGLGDVVAIDWLNAFPWLTRRKIIRRWKRFYDRIYQTSEVRAQREREKLDPQQVTKSLKPNY